MKCRWKTSYVQQRRNWNNLIPSTEWTAYSRGIQKGMTERIQNPAMNTHNSYMLTVKLENFIIKNKYGFYKKMC